MGRIKKEKNGQKVIKSRKRYHSDSSYSDYSDDSYSSTSHSSDYEKDRKRKKRRKHRKESRSRSRSRSRDKRKRKKRNRKESKLDNDLGANHPFNKNVSKEKMSHFMRNRRSDSSSNDDY